MKIVIFSDSHGKKSGMVRVLKEHPNAELVIHLGDGTRDFDALRAVFPDKGFVSVPGNAEDPLASSPVCTVMLDCEGKRLMLTHGHAYGVKEGLTRLVFAAREKGADAVLFGHTHEAYEEYYSDCEHPFYIFNPGSISRPYRAKPSYGLLEIRKDAMLFSHGTI